jgi:hypothetical protein
MEEYNLPDIVVTFAGFIHSSTTNINKKRRAIEYVKKNVIPYYRHCHYSNTVDACRNNTNTTGDVFIVVFNTKYPKNCITNYSRQKYLSQIYSYIRNISHTLNLIVTLTNNETIHFESIFCSFGPVDTGKHLQFSQNSSQRGNRLFEDNQ